MSEKSLSVEELLKNIDVRISHIEDIMADNRSIIIKLVKQNNTIVTFLKQVDIEAEEVMDLELSMGNKKESENSEKMKDIEALVDTFIDKSKDLQELERELKKHKDKITPGQVGEA